MRIPFIFCPHQLLLLRMLYQFSAYHVQPNCRANLGKTDNPPFSRWSLVSYLPIRNVLHKDPPHQFLIQSSPAHPASFSLLRLLTLYSSLIILFTVVFRAIY